MKKGNTGRCIFRSSVNKYPIAACNCCNFVLKFEVVLHLCTMPDFEYDETTSLVMRFERMLAEDRQEYFDIDELEIIIDYYYASEELKKALKVADYGAAYYPGSEVFPIRKAQIYMDLGRIDESRRVLKKAAEIDPDNPDVLYLHAEIHSKTGNHQLAIQYLKKLIYLYPEDTEALSFLASEYMAVSNYQQAIVIYRQLIEEFPEDHFVLHNLVTCYDETGNQEEAIKLLNTVIDKVPYNEVAWHNLGNMYAKTGNYEKAIWAYEYSILIDENYIAPYYDLGYTYEIVGNYQKAIEIYNAALEIDIFTAHSYLCLGRCYEALNLNKKALYCYKKALEEDESNPAVHAALIKFYTQKDYHPKAVLKHIKRLLQLEPDAESKLMAAKILFAHRFDVEAMELTLDLMAEQKYDKELMLYYTRVLLGTNRLKMAIKILRFMSKLLPEDVHIRILLSAVYLINDNIASANIHFRKVRKLTSITLDDLVIFFESFLNTDDLSEWMYEVNLGL